MDTSPEYVKMCAKAFGGVVAGSAMMTPTEFYRRFGRKIKKTESCWLWLGYRHADGYGWIWGKINCSAHRFSYQLHFGKIPKGFKVLHKCDNPSCVNPEHLFIGTDSDNAKDRTIKKRGAFGERMGRAKLSVIKVIDIRKRYASGGLSFKRLSDELGVCVTTVEDAIKGKTWKCAN